MGSQSSNQIVDQAWKKDGAFWKIYYEKTGNYSVGPARTITTIKSIERTGVSNSRDIYLEYKGKEHLIPNSRFVLNEKLNDSVKLKV